MTKKLHTQYYSKDGTWLPGVTTILNEWSEGYKALANWQIKQTKLGNNADAVGKHAADIGTCAHYLVYCHVLGIQPNLDQFSKEVQGPAKICFRGFKKWERQHKPIYLFTELEVVSNRFMYGGTIDMGVIVDGSFGILDIKTGGAYTKHRAQLVAYGMAWVEMWNEFITDDYITALDMPEYYLLQLNKNKVGFSYHVLGGLDVEWKIFTKCNDIYQLKKEL